MENDHEKEECCGEKGCSICAFVILLIFGILFILLFASTHALLRHTIENVYGVQGAFVGIYMILILDIMCAALGILACSQNVTKCLLIIIYIALGLNCVVNAFVGLFITTGIKKIYPLPTLTTTDRSPSLSTNIKKPIDCVSETDDDCRKLGIIQICFYLMYLQMLIRVIVLCAARRAFFIDNGGGRRASFGVPVFIQRRISNPPRISAVREHLSQSHSMQHSMQYRSNANFEQRMA